MKNILNSNVYLDDTLLRKTLVEYDVEYLFDCIKEEIPYIAIPKNFDGDGVDFISLDLFNRGMSILINYASYVKHLTNKNIVTPIFEVDNTSIVIAFQLEDNVSLKFILFDKSNYIYVSYHNNYCFINALEINISQMLDEINPFSDIFILFPVIVNDVVVNCVEKPQIVGTLNKNFGYNGYKPILAGTPVYEIDGTYFFYGEVEASGIITGIKFNKETLEPAINKL